MKATSWLAGLVFATTAVPCTAQCPYEVTAIIIGPECPEGPAGVLGWGLSDDGVVVGDFTCQLGRDKAFVWYPDGRFAPITMPAGTDESRALAVVEGGSVVGWHIAPPPFAREAFLFDGTETVPLGVLPSHNASFAWAKNASGEIVGWSGHTITGPGRTPVVWKNGEITDLRPVLKSDQGEATDINDEGIIVGWRGGAPFRDGRAFSLDLAAGQFVDIGVTPGGFTGQAEAVNARGDVAGYGWVVDPEGDGKRRSFVWSNGRKTALGLLPGRDQCLARDINDLGTIVGGCKVFSKRDVAFVWQEGVMSDLDDLVLAEQNLRLTNARAINNLGTILAWGTYDGSAVAFLLTPLDVPAPDVTGNCRVNMSDLLMVLSQWGPCDNCRADINADGTVDLLDVQRVLKNWG